MVKADQGLTLIELIIIILAVAVAAVIIVPKFIDLSSRQENIATTAIANALSTANASNYAVRKLNNTLGIAVSNCTDVAGSLQGGLPANYTITSGEVAPDVTINCTLNGPGNSAAKFNATGIK